MAVPGLHAFRSSRRGGKVKGVAAAILGVALVAALPASALTQARAAAADTIDLRLWPAGQGRIDAVQNGSAAGSCDFVTILESGGGDCRVSVTSGVPVTLTAVTEPTATISTELQKGVPDFPAPSTTFVRWSRYDCQGSSCTFTPDADADWVTAFFTPLQLEVGIAGAGTVSAATAAGVNALTCVPATFGDTNPLGFGDTTCHALEPTDAEVVLVAKPANASDAIHWGAGCEPEGGDASSARCAVTMTNIRTFASVAFGSSEPPDFPFQITPRITVHRSGSGHGTVKGSGIDCGSTCTHDFGYQDRVTLKADADSGSTFVRWRGVCSTNPTCVFAAGSATLVDAVFDAKQTTTTATTTTSSTTTTATTTVTATTSATTTTAVTSTSSSTTATTTTSGRHGRPASVRLVKAGVEVRGVRRVVVVSAVLDRGSRADLRLTGARRVVATWTFALAKGRNSIRLSLPRRTVPPGRYRLAVKTRAGNSVRTVTIDVTVRR